MQNIWVLTEDGKILCRKGFVLNLEESLLKNFITALNTIVQEFYDGTLTSFKFNKIRFIVVKKRKFLFIGSMSTKRDKKWSKRLERFVNYFFSFFTPEMIHQWNGNLSLFSDFCKKVNKPKAEFVGEYIEGLWGH